MSFRSVISAGTVAAVLTIATIAAPTSANAAAPGPDSAAQHGSASATGESHGSVMNHECGFCGLRK